MVFTKLLLENALAIRPCNCEAASEPLLPKVVRCIPVLPSRYIGTCADRVLKRSGFTYTIFHDVSKRESLHCKNQMPASQNFYAVLLKFLFNLCS